MQSNQLLLKTLTHLAIPALNDMQQAAFKSIADTPNTVILSPTGSGKTLAFLLPVLELLDKEVPGVQCLILSPTRELAIQIERVWQKMSTGFKVNTCYGGHPMSTEMQNLSQPPAVLIGTPGRIAAHVSKASFAVGSVKIIVFDEFDKSLSLGFQEEMTIIVKALPNLEKRVLASATNKLNIPEFTGITQPNVLNFSSTAEKTTDGLTVKTVKSGDKDKTETLFQLLCMLGAEQTLIFCNHRESTEKTRDALAAMGLESAAFHGGMEQPDREKILVQFRNGSILYLVASDLAARGLDIPEVKNVVHFELPLKLNDFVHRNGRTARMNAEGTAYLLLAAGESVPSYIAERPELLELLETDASPATSPWVTLYISGGKKDKLSKMDIVGFLSKKGNLQKDDVGKIEVLDFMSFVAVKKSIAAHLLSMIQAEKMKGKKYKIGITN